MDEMQRGLVDEDEDAISMPTDRAYWENKKGPPKTVALMERLFALVKEGDPDCDLKSHSELIRELIDAARIYRDG